MLREMQGSRRNRCSSSRPHLGQKLQVAEAEAEAVAAAAAVGQPWRFC